MACSVQWIEPVVSAFIKETVDDVELYFDQGI